MVKQEGVPTRPETTLHQTQKPRHAPHGPSPRQSAPFIRVYLREPPDPGSSLLGMSMGRYKGAMNTWQNDLSVNPCNPFHPYDAWHANLIRIDGLD